MKFWSGFFFCCFCCCLFRFVTERRVGCADTVRFVVYVKRMVSLQFTTIIQYITCAIKWEILVYYIDEVAACRLWGKHVIEMMVEFLYANTVLCPKMCYFLWTSVHRIWYFICARLNSTQVSSSKSVLVQLYRWSVCQKYISLAHFSNITSFFWN